MKSKMFFIVSCLLMTSSGLNAQTVHGETTLVPISTYYVGQFTHNVYDSRTNQKLSTSTEWHGSSYALGRIFPVVSDPTDTTVDSTAIVSRTCFTLSWGNGTGPGQIPSNATNISVLVNYGTGSSGYTFKVTQISSLGSYDASTYWTAAGNGSNMNTPIAYNGSSFPSPNIATAIKNALSSRTVYLGALSENETANNSGCGLTFSLTVDYDRPAVQLSLTARNDLSGGTGGNIGEATYPNSASSHASPYTIPNAYETNKLNLLAYDNQSVSRKNWVFNDNEGPSNKSYWDERVYGTLRNT